MLLLGSGNLKNHKSLQWTKLFIIQFVACSVAKYKYMQHHRQNHSSVTHRMNTLTKYHTTKKENKKKAQLACSSQQTIRILPWSRLVLYKLHSLITSRLLEQRNDVWHRVRREKKIKKLKNFVQNFLPGITDKSRCFWKTSTQLTKYSNMMVWELTGTSADS